MLIYNSQKEFIGIDDKDLKSLGFSNLSQLLDISKEFADLFVKIPKHIHNFKHIHWIDYILCMDSGDEAKVIIEVDGKNYSSSLEVEKAYLTNNPSEEAYLITLKNLKSVDDIDIEDEVQEIKVEPEVVVPNDEIIEPPKEIEVEPEPIELVDDVVDIAVEPIQEIDVVEDDVNVDVVEEVAMVEDEKPQTPTYIFDPKVASDELGLPIDLIEEFIQDFITQAKEFKDGLYGAVESGDLDSVQKLSHKLKGVAANLRIEDALDTLITINLSKDVDEIKQKLDIFYKIISKLAKEDDIVEVAKEEEVQPIIEEKKEIKSDDDIFENLLIDEDVLDEPTPEPIKESDSDDEKISLEKDYIIDINELDIDERISYDKTIAANEIGIDEESFEQLFNDFKYESKLLTDSIEKAIENDDYKTWQQKGVELKSMSENMRIFDYEDSLTTLTNTKDTSVAQEALESIKALITEISEQ